MSEQSTHLSAADQRIATRAAEDKAAHWEAVANTQRETIDRLTAERDAARAELARARDVVGSMVNQYMGYPEGYVTHEFMSAQEDAIEYLEDIGWLKGGELERYYWTPASGYTKDANIAHNAGGGG